MYEPTPAGWGLRPYPRAAGITSGDSAAPAGREILIMQAIVTKYHGPTEHRGPRISATSGSGHQRVYVDIPDNLVAWGEEAHRLAAIALCKKLDWPAAQLVGGGLRNGYVFVLTEALPVLRKLMLAASSRENTMGDPCRLLECQDQLQTAIREALTVLEARS